MTQEDFNRLGFAFRHSSDWMCTEDMAYLLQFKGHCGWTTFTVGSRDEGVPELDWTLIESVEQVTRLLAECGVPQAVAALRKYTIDEVLTEL